MSSARRPVRFPAALLLLTALFLVALVQLLPDSPDQRSRSSEGTVEQATNAQGVIFWYRCDRLIEISDAELDQLERRGVSGFNCSTSHLSGLGGSQRYSADRHASLEGPEYERQRRIRSSRIVSRIHERGMKIYFGFYAAHYNRPVTPYGDWFDDAEWSGTVLPAIEQAAAMARLEGFDGLSLDQEDYSGKDGRRHSWAADYPGRSHRVDEVRDKVRQRGREVMQAMLRGFPEVTINVYHWNFPGGWSELVKHEISKLPADNASRLVHLEFWDGMTSVSGYRAVRFLDSTFFKGIHLSGTWDTALQYNANRLYATFSRRFSGWDHAASRVHVLPFAWVDHTHEEWPYRPREPEFVEEQLRAFRRWTTDGEFFNFVFNTPLSKYDYSPYLSALRAASEPGPVDTTPPTLTVTPVSGGAPTVTLSGTAADNLAVRSIRWKTSSGASGTAQMTWEGSGGPGRGYEWHMEWRGEIPLKGGSNTITVTAEDIKGLTTSTEVVVTGP